MVLQLQIISAKTVFKAPRLPHSANEYTHCIKYINCSTAVQKFVLFLMSGL